MNKRENLLWNIILIVAFFSVIYNGYILYNMNTTSVELWKNYEKEEIGTDKKLKNKVQKLEKNLKEKKEFKFKMKKNPSDLSSVIDFEGLNSAGPYRHFKLETIFYSKKWDEYRALLSTLNTSNYYSTQDTISGGIIKNITEQSLIFEKDNEIFQYELGENQ